jgi:hypothetical protein
MSAATFYPYTEQSGAMNYESYTAAALITTSNNRVSIPFSATNLSRSGATLFRVDLYKKLNLDEEIEISNRRYAITKVVSDNSTYGHYRVSPITGLVAGDFIKVFFDSDETRVATVKISEVINVNTGRTSISSIKTEPGIDLRRAFILKNNDNIKFAKIPMQFDWSSPVQTILIDNSTTPAIIPLPAQIGELKGINDYKTTGNITLGGLTPLFGEILGDKNEYFMTYNVKTTIVSSLTAYSNSLEIYSGYPVIESESKIRNINGIDYRGNYFAFMSTPKIPEIEYAPGVDTSSVELLSPLVRFRGVSDSDGLKIQFVKAGSSSNSSPNPNAYSSLSDSDWNSSTTINSIINLIDGATDSTLYSNKTSLDPNTWYWWRIINYKRFNTLWNYVLETYVATEPASFSSGTYFKQGYAAGEILLKSPQLPSAPEI